MKILNKGAEESTTKGNSTGYNKFIDNAKCIVGSLMVIAVFFILVGPPISYSLNRAVKNYNYNNSGWTAKTETKTYPVSHIRINKETEYYDANQLNAIRKFQLKNTRKKQSLILVERLSFIQLSQIITR